MDSMRAFNTATDANEMLKGLRYFERAISSKDNSVIKDKPAYSWGPVSFRFSVNLMYVCNDFTEYSRLFIFRHIKVNIINSNEAFSLKNS